MLGGGPWGPFLESLGVLWKSLGAFGACFGGLSGSFGDPWGLLCGSLESLGASWPLQGRFLGFSDKVWVAFWLLFGILLGSFFVSFEASVFPLIFDSFEVVLEVILLYFWASVLVVLQTPRKRVHATKRL